MSRGIVIASLIACVGCKGRAAKEQRAGGAGGAGTGSAAASAGAAATGSGSTGTGTGTGTGSGGTTAGTAAAAATGRPKAKADPKPQPLTADEKAARKKFWAAMTRGRDATHEKDYDTANTAFTEALALVKDSPRALGERGYAELLARQYDTAEQDLRKSLSLTRTASLVGADWYNLGLLEEARGNLELARVDFATSNAIHPTKSAAGKLSGKSSCTAEVAAAPAAKKYASWLALWKSYADADSPGGCYEGDDATPKVTTDDEARAALCGVDDGGAPGCAGDAPWLVSYGDPMCALTRSVVEPAADGSLLVWSDLGSGMGGRCGSEDELTVEAAGTTIHLTASRDVQEMEEVYADHDGNIRDVSECEKDCDTLCDRYDCSTACFDNNDEVDDYYLDAKTGRGLVEIVHHGGITFTPAAGDVAIKGAGCEETVPFAK
ncbi:MAG TPA: hypothetical protein VHE35_13455 [Kofleriaceae bacterium]|nr:hypothetical protein [Kofleriaceae bacterium]